MSPSEMKVRTYLALALLLAGILFIRSQASGRAEASQPQSDVNSGGYSAEKQDILASGTVAASEPVERIQATDPSQFSFAAGRDQIVMMYAPWDRISQNAVQLMRTFEEKYRGRVVFSYLDVSNPDNQAALDRLNYWFYPQFAYLDSQGNILEQWTTPSATDMEMAIQKSGLATPLW